MSNSEGIEYYTIRFIVTFLLVSVLSTIYATLFGNYAKIILYGKLITLLIIILGALLEGGGNTSNAYTLAGKASGAAYGGSSSTASDHNPAVSIGADKLEIGGLSTYFTYGGLITMVFLFLIGIFV